MCAFGCAIRQTWQCIGNTENTYTNTQVQKYVSQLSYSLIIQTIPINLQEWNVYDFDVLHDQKHYWMPLDNLGTRIDMVVHQYVFWYAFWDFRSECMLFRNRGTRIIQNMSFSWSKHHQEAYKVFIYEKQY